MRRSWREAFTEIALIFLGITLALFFENWNEDRQARAQEHELLFQILNDLRETRQDLTVSDVNRIGLPGGDLPNLEAAQDAHFRIMEGLNCTDSVAPEAWAQDFAILMRGESRLYPQTAGYQSLKTIGVDLITDDSLRVAITHFFELTLSRVAIGEDRYWQAQDMLLSPYVFAHFRGRIPADSIGEVYPLDLSALCGDPSFQLMMDRIGEKRRLALIQYRRAEGELDSLIGRLENAVSR